MLVTEEVDASVAKIKKQRRKSSSAAIYISACVLMVICFTLFGVGTFLNITQIEVTGVSRYSGDEVINASGFRIGDNLLLLNTNEAKRAIQSMLPFISEVVIEARYPDKVHIAVTESKAVATVRYRSETMVIDSAGRVVAVIPPEESGSAELIEIRGFTPAGADIGSRLRADLSAESQLSYLIDMLRAVEREGYEAFISYIDVSSITNITFDYTERFKVILDSPGSISQNMSSLPQTIALYENDLAPGINATVFREDSTGRWRMLPDR